MFSYDEYRRIVDDCLRNNRFTMSMTEDERSSILEKLQFTEPSIELYQYRRCNEFTFNDFLKNQITLVHPKYFNDCFEVKPYVNLEELVKTYNSYDVNNAKRLIGIAKERDFTPAEIQKIGGRNTAQVLKLTAKALLEQNTEEILYDNFEEIQYKGLMQMSPDLCQICLSKQSETRIACFSENFDSPTMWGHYADAGKGFCIKRYLPIKLNMSLCPSDCSERVGEAVSCTNNNCVKNGNNWLFPVVYCSERPDFTKDIEELLAQTQFQKIGLDLDWSNYNLFSHLKFACYKSSDWEYEHEWRWIRALCTNEIPDYTPISVGRICGLYLELLC